ncbi:MAG: flagellar basal body P-ring protein FlgI [Gammaproteobacteria bacterium]|nr:flagellar basal body P-ring protein FlgI [Gammaproteobacteria bacterium]
MARLSSVRSNALVGYGLVTGLAGTGDSANSSATMQSIVNLLGRFGVQVAPGQMRSRNSASVMITAELPSFARPGDHIDVNVTSMGDARSLVGGTLLMTHLTGPDGKIYAIAQGAISVGGFYYDLYGNVVQKNHPTAAHVPRGATIEKSLSAPLMDEDGRIEYVLFQPDFTTADRLAKAMNKELGDVSARALDAERIELRMPQDDRESPVAFLGRLETIIVNPDNRARIVINERTGTIVSGADVRISPVSVTHGDMKLTIKSEYSVSQPSMLINPGNNVRTEVVPITKIDVMEKEPFNASLDHEATLGDLIAVLNRAKASARDIIVILQAAKQAGALHADIIVQ